MNNIKNILLASLVLFLSATTQAACISNETTANNNTEGTAQAELCSGQTVAGSISSSTDDDWYEFTVGSSGSINISLSHASNNDFDWYLYEESGSVVKTALTSKNPETGSYSASPGTHFIHIERYSGTGYYDLNVTFPEGTTIPDPDPEPGTCTTFTGSSIASSINLGVSGSTADVCTTTSGGFVLMGGGTDVDSAIQWMIQRSGGGDVVILRSSGTNGYNDYVYSDLGGVNSVQTLLIDSAADGDHSGVSAAIKNAEMVFIAGGDQQQYEDFFKGRAVGDALNYLINTKGVSIGGTSAGMAILGEYYHPGGGTETEGMSNPSTPVVNNGFINAPILDNLVTDTHFSNRARESRLVGFMANMVLENADVTWSSVRGIGCDEASAYAVEPNGTGKVFAGGTGSCYMVRATAAPEVLRSGSTLDWWSNQQALEVSACGNGDNFNASSWTGNCVSENWYVDRGTFGKN